MKRAQAQTHVGIASIGAGILFVKIAASVEGDFFTSKDRKKALFRQ
ncbi:MAG: hypothetical protein J5I59_13945 [Saprospiraceae bacterium]|nr:hypothetical protein [Saprospiraceae bacterium]